MLFSQPVFAVNTYIEEPSSYSYDLNLCKSLGPTTAAGYQTFLNIKENQVKLSTPLIKVAVTTADIRAAK